MRSIKKKVFNGYVERFEFDHLFNQLGWDFNDKEFPKKVGELTFQFKLIANKQGFAVLVCQPDSNGRIPDAQTRKRIHAEIAKLHHEHLIIFVDKASTVQQWELLTREPNRPMRTVGHRWVKGQQPELLYQKLSGAFFSLEEDEKGELTIIDVVQRIKENFGTNADAVTTKFYKEFTKQHLAFMAFIKGMDDHIGDKQNRNKQWYTSLMLNRLMFCYFIQRKGFLDQDRKYLSNKLRECTKLAGKDSFYSFYRSFLLNLFHDGLGRPEQQRKADVPVDLGHIPYLNGGLFDVHELEVQFDAIHISDEAFEAIFNFFDRWEWHLDTRDDADGTTINPDVIGYIFEKYINERAEMGAYYTKEDITDYIGKNTIIPFLLDEAARHHKKAFAPDGAVWQLMRESADRYIYSAVRHGMPAGANLLDDLPDDVRAGFRPDMEQQPVRADSRPHLWELRKGWNRRAPEAMALPTETYRELIARRQRCHDLRTTIASGSITSVSQLITHNLDIRQFAQDIIEGTEDPELLRHFYQALCKVTILDPTCGSGAFLFAALNILEPLYRACIGRMEEFVDEQPGRHPFFEKALADMRSEHHPSLNYFIYKSIILNNLFGVDIMKEAVEIAKLRLFLKLVSTVDVDASKPNFGLEPLPDIDFNIRAGNTLVGFATEQDLLTTVRTKDALFAEDRVAEFKEEFALAAQAYRRFQDSQLMTDQGTDSFRQAKGELRSRLRQLNDSLSTYLATNYGIDAQLKPKDYQTWLQSHQPFHWFAEFYDIIAGKGGFDVIIGNPPYVVYNAASCSYRIEGYESLTCANLYAYCSERSFRLLHENSRFGMILPNSSISADKSSPLQKIFVNDKISWISNYAWRPAKLFEGANMLLAVVISVKSQESRVHTSAYNRWYNEYRNALFETISYQSATGIVQVGSMPKLPSIIYYSIIEKTNLKSSGKSVVDFFRKQASTFYFYYFRAVLYWVKILENEPVFREDNIQQVTGEMKRVFVDGNEQKYAFISLLSSSLYYVHYSIWSSCQVINSRDFQFPFDFNALSIDEKVAIVRLGKMFQQNVQANSRIQTRNYSSRGRSFTMEKQYFYIKKSKNIIDEIDTVLSQHYRFTEEELDFIINYDIKYRMGKELYGEVEDTEQEDD